MGTNVTATEVLNVLRDKLKWPLQLGVITDDTPVGSRGIGLDSIMCVEYAVRLEEHFNFEFDDSEVDSIPGLSVGELVSLIRSKPD